MKTFKVTKTNEPIIFEVNDEKFEAVPADNLSAGILSEYFQNINEGNLFKAHDYFFKTVLIEESYERFYTRLNSKTNPITVKVLGDITAWLLGDEYMGGKSWGRSQALISYSLDIWDEFDSWCLMHGIKEHPWTLPSYRFGALVVAYMKEDKVPEGIATIDESLEGTDKTSHPFHDPSFRRMVKAMGHILSVAEHKPSSPSSKTVDNVIYDSRLSNYPDEELSDIERMRRDAEIAGKPFRIPEWWRGEKANYKIAASLMHILPKKIGPVTDKD